MKPSELVQTLLDSGFIPSIEVEQSSYRKQLWSYKPYSALWEPIDPDELQGMVYRATEKYAAVHPELPLPGSQTSYFVRQGAAFLRTIVPKTGPFDRRTDLVPLADRKVLDLKTKTVVERTQKHRFTYSLPVRHHPEADSTEIKKFLQEIFSDRPEEQKRLRELLLGLLEDRLPKKRLHFWTVYPNGGSRSAGASTLFCLILKTFGNLVFKDQLGPDGRLLVLDHPRHLYPQVDLKQCRMVLADCDELPKKLAPPSIFQFIRDYSPHSPEEGIELTAKFARKPVEGELKADPSMFEKICTEENKSAFLNWILQ